MLTIKLASINHHSVSSLKDLKPSLLSSGSQLWDSSEHLGKAIELGLHEVVVGEDKPAKRRKSVSKSPQNISVCLEVIQIYNVVQGNDFALLQVMRAVPMAYSHPELLHRCVLVLTILHVSMVESLVSRNSIQETTFHHYSWRLSRKKLLFTMDSVEQQAINHHKICFRARKMALTEKVCRRLSSLYTLMAH